MKTMEKDAAVSVEMEEKYKELLEKAYLDEGLDEDEQLMIFELPNAEEIFLEYAKRGLDLWDAVQLKIFELPNAEEILFQHVKHGHAMPENIQLRIFKLPNAADIMFEFARKDGGLRDKTLVKVFSLPKEKAAKIMLAFIKNEENEDTELSKEVQLKILTLPNADKILLQYFKNGFDVLYHSVQFVALGHPNAKKIIRKYRYCLFFDVEKIARIMGYFD